LEVGKNCERPYDTPEQRKGGALLRSLAKKKKKKEDDMRDTKCEKQSGSAKKP